MRPLLLAFPLGALAILAVACGGGDQAQKASPTDERVRQISGVAELATNAYASVGPQALFDYLAPNVAEKCTQQALRQALGGSDSPIGFSRIEDVVFESHGKAQVKVVQKFAQDERTAQWVFVPQGSSWRIESMPGLERCAR